MSIDYLTYPLGGWRFHSGTYPPKLKARALALYYRKLYEQYPDCAEFSCRQQIWEAFAERNRWRPGGAGRAIARTTVAAAVMLVRRLRGG